MKLSTFFLAALIGGCGCCGCSREPATPRTESSTPAPALQDSDTAPPVDLIASPVTTPITWQVPVDGMTCAACAGGIEKAVAGLPGVTSCTVSYENGMAVVETDSDADVSEEQIQGAITEAGFQPGEVTSPTP